MRDLIWPVALYLYPEGKYLFYRVGFYDNIVSSDRLSVYVEIGYREDDQIDIESAFERVLKDLREAHVISDHKVVSFCPVIMNPAYVHVTKGMEKDREEKMAHLSRFGVYSIGRYGSWTYCSIEFQSSQDDRIRPRPGWYAHRRR